MSSHIERYGFISALRGDHQSRVHIDGFKPASPPEVCIMPLEETGETYLVFCLDPLSAIGSGLSRYTVPFTPPEDFHFNQASLWIYPVGEAEVRMEIRFSAKRRFCSDEDQHPTEEVYGVQFEARASDWLRCRETAEVAA